MVLVRRGGRLAHGRRRSRVQGSVPDRLSGNRSGIDLRAGGDRWRGGVRRGSNIHRPEVLAGSGRAGHRRGLGVAGGQYRARGRLLPSSRAHAGGRERGVPDINAGAVAGDRVGGGGSTWRTVRLATRSGTATALPNVHGDLSCEERHRHDSAGTAVPGRTDNTTRHHRHTARRRTRGMRLHLPVLADPAHTRTQQTPTTQPPPTRTVDNPIQPGPRTFRHHPTTPATPTDHGH